MIYEWKFQKKNSKIDQVSAWNKIRITNMKKNVREIEDALYTLIKSQTLIWEN